MNDLIQAAKKMLSHTQVLLSSHVCVDGHSVEECSDRKAVVRASKMLQDEITKVENPVSDFMKELAKV